MKCVEYLLLTFIYMIAINQQNFLLVIMTFLSIILVIHCTIVIQYIN